MTTRTLWIGSYTAEPQSDRSNTLQTPRGRGAGIYRIDLDTVTGKWGKPQLAVATPNPSWLVRHPLTNIVLAVSECEDGMVNAFAIDDDGGLSSINSLSSAGSFPCHIALSADADTVIISNYGNGVVSTQRLSVGGSESAPRAPARLDSEVSAVAHSGTGPDASRQTGSHAHSAWLSPQRDVLLVCDLGTDELRRYDIDEFGRLSDPEIAARLPAGSGPRHLAVHDNGYVYVNGELDSTIVVLRWDSIARRARQVQVTSASGESSTQARPAPAHLEFDNRGKFLYTSIRGLDAISVHEIGPDGRLALVGDFPAGGKNPRHFAILDDLFVVAHQDSDTVAAFRLDSATGMPCTQSHIVTIPSPTCIVEEIADKHT